MVRLVMESESGSEEGGDRTCGAHKGWGWGPKPWQALTKGVVEAVLFRKPGVPVKSATRRKQRGQGITAYGQGGVCFLSPSFCLDYGKRSL